jgi:hypothetical protein
MTRRQALLTVLAVLATRVEAHGQDLPPGFLTLPLDKWKGVLVTYQGQSYALAPDELWAALRDG